MEIESEGQHLRHRPYWIACGCTFVFLVIFLSLTPEAPDLGSMNDLKANHLLAYGWTMFWFAQLFRRIPARLAIGVALCALGVALEYVQQWTGYRTFRYSDMVTDALGVTLGLVLSLGPMGGLLQVAELLIAPRD